MTIGRRLAIYLAAGAVVAGLMGAADGVRGLVGTGAAWLVCLVPLFRRPQRPVAAEAPRRRIAGKWAVMPAGAMLFRLAWVLGVGAVLYRRLGDRLGVGYWVALVAFYQVMLAVSVIGLPCRGTPSGRPADPGEQPSDAPG